VKAEPPNSKSKEATIKKRAHRSGFRACFSSKMVERKKKKPQTSWQLKKAGDQH
jgi:hypothetical protein